MCAWLTHGVYYHNTYVENFGLSGANSDESMGEESLIKKHEKEKRVADGEEQDTN